MVRNKTGKYFRKCECSRVKQTSVKERESWTSRISRMQEKKESLKAERALKRKAKVLGPDQSARAVSVLRKALSDSHRGLYSSVLHRARNLRSARFRILSGIIRSGLPRIPLIKADSARNSPSSGRTDRSPILFRRARVPGMIHGVRPMA